MEVASNLVTVHLPNYLTNLPIPKSIGGWFHLSVRDWLHLIPFAGTVSFFAWVTYTKFSPKEDGFMWKKKAPVVNPSISKDSSKVVHSFDIEDLDAKTCFCRCWRSSKFPYCDGSHNDHNKQTGDNVGPLIVKRRD